MRDDSGKREIVFKEKEKIDCANDVGGGKRVPHMRGIFFSFQSFFEQLLFAYFAWNSNFGCLFFFQGKCVDGWVIREVICVELSPQITGSSFCFSFWISLFLIERMDWVDTKKKRKKLNTGKIAPPPSPSLLSWIDSGHHHPCCVKAFWGKKYFDVCSKRKTFW